MREKTLLEDDICLLILVVPQTNKDDVSLHESLAIIACC